jgi:hypothetical protein
MNKIKIGCCHSHNDLKIKQRELPQQGTLTPTPTLSQTNTPTLTPTNTVTATPTSSQNNTPTPTSTITLTPTNTVTATPTSSQNNTPTPTSTITLTPTNTVTATPTHSVTPSTSPPPVDPPDPPNYLAESNTARYNTDNLYLYIIADNIYPNIAGSNGGPSAYGTYDQTGNVSEYSSLPQSIDQSFVPLLGGNYSTQNETEISSSNISYTNPATSSYTNGFRIATITNPMSLLHFVDVGDVNNTADTNGYGSVNYNYKICEYTVAICEYFEFILACRGLDRPELSITDPFNRVLNPLLLTSRFGPGVLRHQSLLSRYVNSDNIDYVVSEKILLDISSLNPSFYTFGNIPIININWFNAARYCNWLHNGKPIVVEPNSSNIEDGAYTLNGKISGAAPSRNSDAKYFLPNIDEWYKAAYYKGGGTNSGYWKYATQQNTIPTHVGRDYEGFGVDKLDKTRIPNTNPLIMYCFGYY